MPRRISWTSEHARNFRLLAVHVVMKTIGLSRNESACARCLLRFTRAIELARLRAGQGKSLHVLLALLVSGARPRRLHLLALRVASALISVKWERYTSELISTTLRRCVRLATPPCPIQKTPSPIR